MNTCDCLQGVFGVTPMPMLQSERANLGSHDYEYLYNVSIVC